MFKINSDKHALLKRKYLKANHSKLVTKELDKLIMLKPYLRKIFLRERTEESRNKYKIKEMFVYTY